MNWVVYRYTKNNTKNKGSSRNSSRSSSPQQKLCLNKLCLTLNDKNFEPLALNLLANFITGEAGSYVRPWERTFREFQRFSGPLRYMARTRPSERFRVHPSWPRHVETRPWSYENFRKLKNFSKSAKRSENLRMLPNASERFRTHPDVSERIRIGPNRSKHVPKLPKTSENVRKKFTPKKNRRAIFFGVIHYASQLAWTNRP